MHRNKTQQIRKLHRLVNSITNSTPVVLCCCLAIKRQCEIRNFRKTWAYRSFFLFQQRLFIDKSSERRKTKRCWEKIEAKGLIWHRCSMQHNIGCIRNDSNQMQLFTMWELCIRNWQTFVKVLLNLKLHPCFAFWDCICHYLVSTYLTHRFEMEMEMRCCTVMCCAVILQTTKSGCDSAASRERKK